MRSETKFARYALAWVLCVPAPAQSTQGLISGHVTDSLTGSAIPNAVVECAQEPDGQPLSVRTDTAGFFALPLLSPGTYFLRVGAGEDYQQQERYGVLLPVASSITTDFRLRPKSDVWEANIHGGAQLQGGREIVNARGPDFRDIQTLILPYRETRQTGLEAALSEVISSERLHDLPLAGRDAYTLLITLPGIAADAATTRGLGFTANGQRPSSSNFLLDGVENNNYLTSGPLTSLPPEALGEVRISTSNFSAEYGRTSGYIANAVTQPGGAALHGVFYQYLENEALNANGFAANAEGFSRRPSRERQSGFRAGGAPRRNRWFLSQSLDLFHSRTSGDPEKIQLPTTAYPEYVRRDRSSVRTLLDPFRASLPDNPAELGAARVISPPIEISRSTALTRVDRHWKDGEQRTMFRAIGVRVEQPEFIWSPYAGFSAPLIQTSVNLAGSHIGKLGRRVTGEFRASMSDDDLHWDRPGANVPTLVTREDPFAFLPGSLAMYAYRNRSRTGEWVANLLRAGGRHTAKWGGGMLLRRLSGELTSGRDGIFEFPTLIDFYSEVPSVLRTSVPRLIPGEPVRFKRPDYDRTYSNRQFFFFAQDSWRISPQLVLNAGARYENFGAPRPTAAFPDITVALGDGADWTQRISGARLIRQPGQPLYDADNNNLAGRFGLSFEPAGGTVVRAGYGLFYDRPFDNLWQNLRLNGVVEAIVNDPFQASSTSRVLDPTAGLLSSLNPAAIVFSQSNNLLLYQPGLRDGYVQSYFLTVQQELSRGLVVEVGGLGSDGRKLLTTDQLNRTGGPRNMLLPALAYRANQGVSEYRSLNAVVRWIRPGFQWQASYSWSHAIDVQSDALAGDFYNLFFVRSPLASAPQVNAAFSRQSDNRGDRGNADFDQRHNLTFFGAWEFLRGWHVAGIGAVRSGFPFTVYAPGGDPILNRRADLIAPGQAAVDLPSASGRLLLNGNAFAMPAAGTQGNTGRNGFGGPGLFNLDLSVSRGFAVRALRESARITIRADAYNALNHANLNAPDVFLGPDFGQARFGRTGTTSSFPALTPFVETGRRMQVMLRLEF